MCWLAFLDEKVWSSPERKRICDFMMAYCYLPPEVQLLILEERVTGGLGWRGFVKLGGVCKQWKGWLDGLFLKWAQSLREGDSACLGIECDEWKKIVTKRLGGEQSTVV